VRVLTVTLRREVCFPGEDLEKFWARATACRDVLVQPSRAPRSSRRVRRVLTSVLGTHSVASHHDDNNNNTAA
jgi:hypothetical protein